MGEWQRKTPVTICCVFDLLIIILSLEGVIIRPLVCKSIHMVVDISKKAVTKFQSKWMKLPHAAMFTFLLFVYMWFLIRLVKLQSLISLLLLVFAVNFKLSSCLLLLLICCMLNLLKKALRKIELRRPVASVQLFENFITVRIRIDMTLKCAVERTSATASYKQGMRAVKIVCAWIFLKRSTVASN